MVIVAIAAGAAWCHTRWFLQTQVDLTDVYRPKAQRSAQAEHKLPEFSLKQLEGLLEEPRLRLVDARPREDYVAGHIPLAFSVPADRLPESLGVAVQWLASEDLIVVYCESSSCGDGWRVASALADLEFKDIRVLEGGWQVWNGLNRQVQKGQPWYEDQAKAAAEGKADSTESG